MYLEALYGLRKDILAIGYECLGPFHSCTLSTNYAGSGEESPCLEARLPDSFLQYVQVFPRQTMGGHGVFVVLMGVVEIKDDLKLINKMFDLRDPNSFRQIMNTIQLLMPIDGSHCPCDTTDEIYRRLDEQC